MTEKEMKTPNLWNTRRFHKALRIVQTPSRESENPVIRQMLSSEFKFSGRLDLRTIKAAVAGCSIATRESDNWKKICEIQH